LLQFFPGGKKQESPCLGRLSRFYPPEKGEKIVTQKRPPGHESQAGAASFFEIKKQNYVYYLFLREDRFM
jgi:hypothetical protein